MKANNQISKGKGISILSKIIPILVICVIAVGIILINKNTDKDRNKEANSEVAKVVDDDLIIPVDQVTDQATFFPVTMDGTELEVIALKASDGTIRTAFNTCQVCYNSGRGYYEQDGENLVCQNCGNRFELDEVGVSKGGCNPIPITEEYKKVSDNSILISKEFLKEATVVFTNWNK